MPFGNVGQVHHQVLRVAKAQEAQRQLYRQQAVVRALALRLELADTASPGAGAFPQLQPAVHAQARLEVAQRPLQKLAFGITEHAFSGVVGVPDMAVPVDPQNTHRTLVNRELAQAQGLFTHLALHQAFPRSQQATLQLVLLPALPHQGSQGAQQQQAEQQRQVLPEPGRLAQARVLGLQPALVQLLQLLGRQGLQALFEHIGQHRPVTPRAKPQQLRQANIAHHGQLTELALA